MELRHLPAYEYRRMRWANGLGWTREIDRSPAQGESCDWRVSIAEIDRGCAYSAYPGMQRDQVLLEGNGLALRFPDGRNLPLAPPHGRASFAGEPAPECALDDGPVRVFNLIHDPARIAARVHHRPLVGTLVVFAEPGCTWLAYVLSGRVTLRGEGRHMVLAQGDTLRLDNAGESRQRQLLEGGGEILLVSLSPVS